MHEIDCAQRKSVASGYGFYVFLCWVWMRLYQVLHSTRFFFAPHQAPLKFHLEFQDFVKIFSRGLLNNNVEPAVDRLSVFKRIFTNFDRKTFLILPQKFLKPLNTHPRESPQRIFSKRQKSINIHINYCARYLIALNLIPLVYFFFSFRSPYILTLNFIHSPITYFFLRCLLCYIIRFSLPLLHLC